MVLSTAPAVATAAASIFLALSLCSGQLSASKGELTGRLQTSVHEHLLGVSHQVSSTPAGEQVGESMFPHGQPAEDPGTATLSTRTTARAPSSSSRGTSAVTSRTVPKILAGTVMGLALWRVAGAVLSCVEISGRSNAGLAGSYPRSLSGSLGGFPEWCARLLHPQTNEAGLSLDRPLTGAGPKNGMTIALITLLGAIVVASLMSVVASVVTLQNIRSPAQNLEDPSASKPVEQKPKCRCVFSEGSATARPLTTTGPTRVLTDVPVECPDPDLCNVELGRNNRDRNKEKIRGLAVNGLMIYFRIPESVYENGLRQGLDWETNIHDYWVFEVDWRVPRPIKGQKFTMSFYKRE